MMIDKHVKEMAIKAVLEEGMGIAEVVAKYGGFTESTLYRWIEKARNENEEEKIEPQLNETLSLYHSLVHECLLKIKDAKTGLEPRDMTGLTNALKMLVENANLRGKGMDDEMKSIMVFMNEVN